MNRTILTVSGLFGASSPFSASSLLLMDSSVKGTALLVLAAVAAVILRRDSAATRHFVWLLAMVAMLAVPVLSAMLPEWRVLPEWAGIPPTTAVVALSPPSIARPADAARALMPNEPDEVDPPSATAYQPSAALPDSRPDSRPALVAPEAIPTSAVGSWNWINAMPAVWSIGFSVLILRLLAARWMLCRLQSETGAERHATVIWPSRLRAEATHDSVVTALQAVSSQLGISRPVSLLIHPDKTIPVVWGILRCRLLLPAAARHWSGEQLRSVLLHELAHIKSRDTLAQLLAQIACAVYWFNPLVWFAAWRLHVERERACDDLVLAHGVRASVYAEHLLNVATKLSPASWTSACGLAMARQSSLEGRLHAVLSEKLNRRKVSATLGAIALTLGAGIAIPVAMLRAAGDQPAVTEEDEPAAAAEDEREQPAAAATELKPKQVEAQLLFKRWQANARTDGKIPGALIGELGAQVKYFISLNKDDKGGHDLAVRFEQLLARFDATSDWTPSDAIALLDDVSAIHSIPLSNTLEAAEETIILAGEPLPTELAGAAWGKPAPDGLRVAWLLTPRAKEYRLGTELKSRILLHNSGKETAIFSVPSFQQSSAHAARDAKGAVINVSSTYWTTMARMMTYQLAPGEYCEASTPGIGVGAKTDDEDWANVRAGAWIEAKEGDEVRFTPAAVEVRFSASTVGVRMMDGRPLTEEAKDAADLWGKIIAERVARELPLPAAPAEREQIIRRVTLDLFREAPTPEEIAAFIADDPPTAQAALEKRLQSRHGIAPFTGTLPPGEIQFRVLAADPDAAKRPRVATEPGYYNLGDNQRLQVEQTPNGDRRANKATILFFSSDPKTEPPGKPYEIALPEGRLRFAIAWERGTGMLWIAQKGLVRNYDFTNPAQVKETRLEDPAHLDKVPKPILDAMRAALGVKELGVKEEVKIERGGAGAQAGKLAAGESSGAAAASNPEPNNPEPNNPAALALFKVWQDHARGNGDIPGGLVGRLGDGVKEFIRNNTGDASGDPYAKKMAPLVPRFDAARDWTPAEAAALLDDVAAVSDGLLRWTKDKITERTIRRGSPLPPELASAPWGQAQPNGLRLAWMLEPRDGRHRLGTALKSRIYIHNSGKGPVVFRTHTWHQSDGKARDAKGAQIDVSGISWTTVPPLVPFRLAPGEFIELTAPGIGVGKGAGMGEWADVPVGTIVEANEGDEVTFTPWPVSLSKRGDGGAVDGEPRWWLEFIAERLNRELPLPAAAAERTRLLDRAVRELFSTAPTAEETATFVADADASTLDLLAKRLAHRAGITPYSGSLQSGATKFRVLAADPDEASRPRVAIGPGEYPLCHNAALNATLKIVGRLQGDRHVNEAEIRFLEPEEEVIPPPGPYKLEVPDGWGTWAIVCRPGTGVLWLMSRGAVRKIDYSNPDQVTETPIKPGGSDDMPGELRDAVKHILTIYDVPAAEQEALLSKVATNAAPASEPPK